MFRRATIVIALAMGALLATLAPPAHAAESLRAKCSTNGYDQDGRPNGPELIGTAYYTPVTAQSRRWTRINYRLGGSLIGSWGDKNNVNISLFERDWEWQTYFGGDEPVLVPVTRVRYSYESPDDRRFGTTYAVFPNVLTTNNDMYGDPNDFVRFEAIFDKSLAPDPRCHITRGPV